LWRVCVLLTHLSCIQLTANGESWHFKLSGIATSSVELRALDLRYVNLLFILFFSRYLQDHRADLNQISQEDWAAIEKLCFWFLNSFGCGREVTFASDPASHNAVWWQKGLTCRKKTAVRFWPDNLTVKR